MLLLDRPDTDPDLVMEGGRSALMLAAASKSENEMVNLLLDRGGIDVNRQVVPLSARLLVSNASKMLSSSWAEIIPNLPDNFGRTVLLWACDSECLSVVNLLLEREDVNPKARNELYPICIGPCLSSWRIFAAQLLCAHFFLAALH